MRVNPIVTGLSFRKNDEVKKRNQINRHQMVPLTGYVAIGGGLVAGISGFKHDRLVHKIASAVALFAAVAHVLLLKTMHGLGNNQHKRV